MHTDTKLIEIKGISVPAILFLAGMVAGYYISSGNTFSLESDEEYTNESIYYSDSGQYSFPVFLSPF